MLLEAARRRLELWDLSEAQIDEIARTRQADSQRHAVLPRYRLRVGAQRLSEPARTPDTELYTISDLSRVWIMADVFETDLAGSTWARRDRDRRHRREVRPFTARVSYMQPQVDPQTRTLKVRLEAENPGMRLKPDMFVDVQFAIAASAKLTVPADAVLDTGTKQTVYIDRGNGYLEPRPVEIGERMGTASRFVNGLKPGERIVTSGNISDRFGKQLQR